LKIGPKGKKKKKKKKKKGLIFKFSPKRKQNKSQKKKKKVRKKAVSVVTNFFTKIIKYRFITNHIEHMLSVTKI
jgi:hypothetical protein